MQVCPSCSQRQQRTRESFENCLSLCALTSGFIIEHDILGWAFQLVRGLASHAHNLNF